MAIITTQRTARVFEGTIDGLSIGSASTLNYKILSTQDIGGLSRFTVEMDYGNGWVTVGNYRSRVYSRPATVSYTYDFTPASTQAKYRLTWNIASDRPDGGDDISIGRKCFLVTEAESVNSQRGALAVFLPLERLIDHHSE
ncbi:hypothetical protein P4S70_03700 [Enterovibrio sp. Hal110]